MLSFLEQFAAPRHWFGSVSVPTPSALMTTAPVAEKLAALIDCAQQGLAILQPSYDQIEVMGLTVPISSFVLMDTVNISVASNPESENSAIVLVYAGAIQLAEIIIRATSTLNHYSVPDALFLVVAQRTPTVEAIVVQLGKQNHEVLLIDPQDRRSYLHDYATGVVQPGHLMDVTDTRAMVLERGVSAALLFPEATARIKENEMPEWATALCESLQKFQWGAIIELRAPDSSSVPSYLGGWPLYSAQLFTESSHESPSEVADRILTGVMKPEKQHTESAPPLSSRDDLGLRDQLHALIRKKLSLPATIDLSAGGLSLTAGWDSLRHIQLLLEVEEHFEIEFTSSEIEKSALVTQIEQLLSQKLALPLQ